MSLNYILNIFLILISLSNFIFSTKDKYNIQELEEYSIIKNHLNISGKYIYYLDISSYSINDENIIQILGSDFFIKNLNICEINETIIINNNSDIDIIENYPKSFHIKYKMNPKRYYFEILIKKRKENQKYFTLLIEPKLIENNTETEIIVSKKFPQITIRKSEISNGKYFTKTHEMHSKIETFIKYNISNISLENHNLILFVLDKGVSSFYINNLTNLDKRTKLYIFPKNSTKEKNHIIYLSLLGHVNKTTFQIMLDNEHDLSYIYSSSRNITNFYLERINCTKDFYIFESYFDSQDKMQKEIFYLDINPIYGDYDLYYFYNFFGNILSIFKKDNQILDKINGLKPVNNDLTGLKFVCRNPSLIGVKYLAENINLNISEGKEITCVMEFGKFNKNFINISDINREYKFYIGFYKINTGDDIYISNIQIDNINSAHNLIVITTNTNKTEYVKQIYYEKGKEKLKYSIQTYNDKTNFKIFLISNQYYLNVVEGLTKINTENKAIAVKIRKDIIFDYFIFKAHCFNLSNDIPIHYELKIVNKKDIEKDKVMQGINIYRYYFQKEIFMKFSNPYNKFNSRVKEDDYVYLLVEFLIKDEFYPIYIDLRYYYNDKIISIEETKPKIILNKKEYKIYGNNNVEIDNILININKCKDFNNYSIEAYYENNNNLIFFKNITDKRTLLFHKNIYNNSKIIFYSNESDKDIFLEKASYYENGDIYMNYFPFNKNLNNLLQITKDYSISYEDINSEKISFKWNPYLLNAPQEFPVNYSLYILPQSSPINSICQMSLIPPNISLINEINYNIELPKGKYKISIIASVINNNFPLVTFYDFLNFEVSKRIHIKLIVIISISSLILIIGTSLLFFFCKKNNKKTNENLRLEKQSKLLSALGFEVNNDQEGILFYNEDDDLNNEGDNSNNKNVNKSAENKKFLDISNELKDKNEKVNNNFSLNSV